MGLFPDAGRSPGEAHWRTLGEEFRAHGAWRPSLLAFAPTSRRDKTKGGDLNGPAGRATPPPGRHHPGTVGAIISQGWAKSFRAGGLHHLGVPGAIIPE